MQRRATVRFTESDQPSERPASAGTRGGSNTALENEAVRGVLRPQSRQSLDRSTSTRKGSQDVSSGLPNYMASTVHSRRQSVGTVLRRCSEAESLDLSTKIATVVDDGPYKKAPVRKLTAMERAQRAITGTSAAFSFKTMMKRRRQEGRRFSFYTAVYSIIILLRICRWIRHKREAAVRQRRRGVPASPRVVVPARQSPTRSVATSFGASGIEGSSPIGQTKSTMGASGSMALSANSGPIGGGSGSVGSVRGAGASILYPGGAKSFIPEPEKPTLYTANERKRLVTIGAADDMLLNSDTTDVDLLARLLDDSAARSQRCLTSSDARVVEREVQRSAVLLPAPESHKEPLGNDDKQLLCEDTVVQFDQEGISGVVDLTAVDVQGQHVGADASPEGGSSSAHQHEQLLTDHHQHETKTKSATKRHRRGSLAQNKYYMSMQSSEGVSESILQDVHEAARSGLLIALAVRLRRKKARKRYIYNNGKVLRASPNVQEHPDGRVTFNLRADLCSQSVAFNQWPAQAFTELVAESGRIVQFRPREHIRYSCEDDDCFFEDGVAGGDLIVLLQGTAHEIVKESNVIKGYSFDGRNAKIRATFDHEMLYNDGSVLVGEKKCCGLQAASFCDVLLLPKRAILRRIDSFKKDLRDSIYNACFNARATVVGEHYPISPEDLREATPLFSTLTDSQLQGIHRALRPRSFYAGQLIHERDDDDFSMHFIARGRAIGFALFDGKENPLSYNKRGCCINAKRMYFKEASPLAYFAGPEHCDLWTLRRPSVVNLMSHDVGMKTNVKNGAYLLRSSDAGKTLPPRILRSTRLFRHMLDNGYMTEKHVRELRRLFVYRMYSQGDLLLTSSQRVSEMILLLSGQAMLHQHSRRRRLPEETMYGDLCAIPLRWRFVAIAETVVDAWCLNADDFAQYAKRHGFYEPLVATAHKLYYEEINTDVVNMLYFTCPAQPDITHPLDVSSKFGVDVKALAQASNMKQHDPAEISQAKYSNDFTQCVMKHIQKEILDDERCVTEKESGGPGARKGEDDDDDDDDANGGDGPSPHRRRNSSILSPRSLLTSPSPRGGGRRRKQKKQLSRTTSVYQQIQLNAAKRAHDARVRDLEAMKLEKRMASGVNRGAVDEAARRKRAPLTTSLTEDIHRSLKQHKEQLKRAQSPAGQRPGTALAAFIGSKLRDDSTRLHNEQGAEGRFRLLGLLPGSASAPIRPASPWSGKITDLAFGVGSAKQSLVSRLEGCLLRSQSSSSGGGGASRANTGGGKRMPVRAASAGGSGQKTASPSAQQGSTCRGSSWPQQHTVADATSAITAALTSSDSRVFSLSPDELLRAVARVEPVNRRRQRAAPAIAQQQVEAGEGHAVREANPRQPAAATTTTTNDDGTTIPPVATAQGAAQESSDQDGGGGGDATEAQRTSKGRPLSAADPPIRPTSAITMHGKMLPTAIPASLVPMDTHGAAALRHRLLREGTLLQKRWRSDAAAAIEHLAERHGL